jgi:hypothetical protein
MIVRLKDNVVTHDHNYHLTEIGAVKYKIVDASVNTTTAVQINDVELPRYFKPGNYTYTDGVFSITSRGVTKIKEKLLNDLNKYARKIETGGILVNGSPVQTTTKAQNRLNGVYAACQLNTERIINFKSYDGSWVQLSVDAVNAIASAVADHVQACFTHEKSIAELINSAESYDDFIAIDITVGWPTVVEVP